MQQDAQQNSVHVGELSGASASNITHGTENAHKILPLFEQERMLVNNGGPYQSVISQRGRKPQLKSIDILGMCLWFLKFRCVSYRLCLIFGVGPTTLYVWLDFGMEVLC